MGDLYASAVGTSVIQIKTIPPRPKEYDGALCLAGVADVDEKVIRANLERFGKIEKVEPLAHFEGMKVVSFADADGPDEAIANFDGVRALLESKDKPDAFRLYNDRKYDDRGWCCFKEAVSSGPSARSSRAASKT